MLLSLDHVLYQYKDIYRQVDILKECSYEFEAGKAYAIVGASGSGKTTLLTLLAGLEHPIQGNVLYNNESIQKFGLNKYRRNKISMVFQTYNLIPYLNAYQNVLCAMDIAHIQMKNKKEYAIQILENLGLTAQEAKSPISKLSGGQMQRVAIARAIAKESDIILCDEPTGNLDEDNAYSIMNEFIKLAHENNKCIIVVTHSKSLSYLFDTTLKICDGQLKEVN